MGYELVDFAELDISVAMTDDLHRSLESHFDKGPHQEDLTFAYWRPSAGKGRFTAILGELALPGPDDRILQGNVAFESRYLLRVFARAPAWLRGRSLALPPRSGLAGYERRRCGGGT